MKYNKIFNIVITVLIILLMLLFLFPFIISVLVAVRTPEQTAQGVFVLPDRIHWENFTIAMEKTNFFLAFKNSAITTFGATFAIVCVSSINGYAISRFGKKPVFKFLEVLYLAALMIPGQITMIPQYKVYHTLDLMNSLTGVILAFIGGCVPYSTFLYIRFVKTVPYALEEAARIDGCNRFTTFTRIVFPLLKPITATVATLYTLWLWNDFNTALLLLQKDVVRTLPVKQYFFFGQYSADLHLAFASTILCTIPVLIFFLIAQKYIVAGITVGSVKG